MATAGGCSRWSFTHKMNKHKRALHRLRAQARGLRGASLRTLYLTPAERGGFIDRRYLLRSACDQAHSRTSVPIACLLLYAILFYVYFIRFSTKLVTW